MESTCKQFQVCTYVHVTDYEYVHVCVRAGKMLAAEPERCREMRREKWKQRAHVLRKWMMGPPEFCDLTKSKNVTKSYDRRFFFTALGFLILILSRKFRSVCTTPESLDYSASAWRYDIVFENSAKNVMKFIESLKNSKLELKTDPGKLCNRCFNRK